MELDTLGHSECFHLSREAGCVEYGWEDMVKAMFSEGRAHSARIWVDTVI